MGRTPRVLGPALLVVFAVSCAQPVAVPARYALVYGVSRYVAGPEGEGPNLTYSDDDARGMGEQLLADGYAVTVRVDEQATRDNIVLDLQSVASMAQTRDLLLVYFSGHGGVLSDFGLGPADTAGYPSEARWILPYGSIDPAYAGPYLRPVDIRLSEAISSAELQAMVEPVPCAAKVVIIDACNSGGFIAGGAEVDALPPDYRNGVSIDRAAVFARALSAYLRYTPAGSGDGLPPSEALVVAAAGADEPSYEYAPLGHGVFTYFLLEAATRGDLDGDGYVTVMEAYAYAAAGIQEYWNAAFGTQPQLQFLPHVSGGPVDFVLFHSP